MSAPRRFAQAKTVAGSVLRRPDQVRYVPRLLRSVGSSTLDLREPWLPYSVIDLLTTRLDRSASVLEFGGGGSTAFFADRVGSVTTVEHDQAWRDAIAQSLESSSNVRVLFRSSANDYADYVAAADEMDDESLDVVLVDGRQRVACARSAMPKLKPGGLLILDDSDRPKYREAHILLGTWNCREHRGLVPTKDHLGVTSIWTKPSNA